MATCNAIIKSGKRKGKSCGNRLYGREFCGYHNGHLKKSAKPAKRRPRRRIPPPSEGECCSICTDEMTEYYTRLECGHYYHTACIAQWFETSENRSCCVCRAIDIHTTIPGIENPLLSSPAITPTSSPTLRVLTRVGQVYIDSDEYLYISPDIPPSGVRILTPIEHFVFNPSLAAELQRS
jgi:hypothetical protein